MANPRARDDRIGQRGRDEYARATQSAAIAHVRAQGVQILLGPVDRTGATSQLRSFYFRDPDQNLIEVANRVAAAPM